MWSSIAIDFEQTTSNVEPLKVDESLEAIRFVFPLQALNEPDA
jgi:hypothetical protein